MLWSCVFRNTISSVHISNKSFDSIYKSVYTRNVGTENKRYFNNNTSTFTFLLLMFAAILLPIVADFVVGEVSEANEFFILAGLSAVRYVVYFFIFVFVCRLSNINSNVLFNEFGLNKKIGASKSYISIILAGLCIVGAILASGAISELFHAIGYLESEGPAIDSFEKYIVLIIVSAVLPAVIEELLFRGLILKGLLQFGRWKALIGSAVLFSLFHLNPSQTVYQFILGIVLAVVVLKTGKLMYAMILHFVNNFSILTYTYIAGNVLVIDWSAFVIVLAVVLAVISALFIVALVKELGKNKDASLPNKYVEGEGRQAFFSSTNIGYFICVGLASCIWLLVFLSGLGALE